MPVRFERRRRKDEYLLEGEKRRGEAPNASFGPETMELIEDLFGLFAGAGERKSLLNTQIVQDELETRKSEHLPGHRVVLL